MEYKIKQRQIKKMFEIDELYVDDPKDVRKHQELMKRMTMEQRAYKFIMGYLHSITRALESKSDTMKLDLTYETVENMYTGLGALFQWQKHQKVQTEMNIQIIEKSIAAYLILLAINEHNAAISVTPKKQLGGWSGCDIVLEKSGKKVDFLKDITGKVYFKGGKLIIYMKQLMATYKDFTGKDLAECGIDDIEISFD